MQVEMKDFNSVYVARLLAVSRAYFCADLVSVVNGKKREGFKGEGFRGEGFKSRNRSVDERFCL